MAANPVTPERIHAQAIGQSSSQATEIERSRAIAEAQGALLIAQRFPREQAAAIERIREACKQLALAEVAFFKFPRGGETVSGESIHMATELARCWGNVSYGIKELSRSDAGGESEMLAYAQDLETNTRAEMAFIVPHRRDTRQGPKALTDMRDIYENNANMGARRLRECIFRILPTHVREVGKSTCLETLQKGESEKPLPVRLASLFEIAEGMGISKARIEAKLGAVASLTAVDAASLHVSLRSIKRNEVSAEEEFPRVGTEEATKAAQRLADQTKKPKPAEAPADTVTDDNPTAAEGPADEQRGEAFTDEAPATILGEIEQGEARRIEASALIAEVSGKELLTDLEAWLQDKTVAGRYRTLSDELKVEVDAAVSARRRTLEAA